MSILHIYLEVRIFVFVHTRWHKHGPALHLPSVQLEGFRDRHWWFKLYIAVAFEVPFVAENRANLFDGAAGLKQRPELCLRLLQRVRQVADENAAVIVAKLCLVVVLPLGSGRNSLLGLFSARWSRLIAGGSVPPKESRLGLHVLLCGVVPVSSVPFRSLFFHRGHERLGNTTFLKCHASYRTNYIYLSPHSTHRDNHPALLSSSPQLEFPSGPSSEPSCLTWPSAADQPSPPLGEPGWLLCQPPNRCAEHGNISQKQLNGTPAQYNADMCSCLCSLLINPVQPGLCLLHCHVPVLQRTCVRGCKIQRHTVNHENLL